MKIKSLLLLPLVCLFWAGKYQVTKAQISNDGLELYLPLDGNTQDHSNFDRHGILEGATLTTDRFGNQNSAYAFDSGANIRVPNFSSTGFNGVTISTWIKTSKTSPQQQVIQGLVGVLYVNWIKTGHFMAAFDGTAGNNKPGEISKTYVADGKWHHIAATNDGTTTRIYVDGTLEASYNEPLMTGIRDIQIGGGGWYFTGNMDEIRIYSRALPPTDIKALQTGTATSIINRETAERPFNIYPNPANIQNQLYIDLPQDIKNGELTITSLTGRQVYTKTLINLQKGNTLPVELKHFSSGVYMMNVISEKGINRTKLVIQ